jgi:hypothetical protein
MAARERRLGVVSVATDWDGAVDADLAVRPSPGARAAGEACRAVGRVLPPPCGPRPAAKGTRSVAVRTAVRIGRFSQP